MDVDRMLERCHRLQWNVDDLDWSVPAPAMSRDKEIAVVQYFTDMASIERLAKALFVEQRRRTDDPVLAEIFATFVIDEERHAQCAERLARHYDVHHYVEYGTNRALLRFEPHFLEALQYLSAEVANVYITSGELLLDVALLRSIDDYVDDAMSKQAMRLINRDESRHIAIDYYMTEYYTSERYLADLRARAPVPPRNAVRAYWAFAHVLFHAAPFFRGVFLEPMERADPSGRRMREAMKRLQLLGARPDVAERPFPRFINTLRRAYETPALRSLAGPLISRLAGVPGDLLLGMYTEEEAHRYAAMSYDELAKDALAAKNLH
jgi:hypothetical protein